MNNPVFAVLVAAGFAAGWWIDARFSRENTPGASAETKVAPAPQENPLPQARAPGASEPPPFASLSEAAPARTLEEFHKLWHPRQTFISAARIRRALNALTTAELAALAAELGRTNTKDEDLKDFCRAVFSPLVERWLPLEPRAALECALDLREDLGRPFLHGLTDALRTVFKTDQSAAAGLLNKLEGEAFYDLRYACFETMKGMEPQAALQAIVDFDAKAQSDVLEADFVGDFPETWIQKDPLAAMNWALQLPPTHTKRQILSEMARAWGKLDATTAQKFLDEVPRSVLPGGNLRQDLEKEIHWTPPQ